MVLAMVIRLLNETTVESCVLLERVSNRKADSYVKLNVKMEDYYRIKDAEGGEADGYGCFLIYELTFREIVLL